MKMNHSSGEYRRVLTLRRKIMIISVCTSPGHQQRAGGDQKQLNESEYWTYISQMVHNINQTGDILLTSAEVNQLTQS